jgi:hypothetical protein
MILLWGIAAGFAVALLRGGGLHELANVRLEWAWLAVIALIVQVALVSWWPSQTRAAAVAFPLTHAAILAVAWLNRDLRGMWLIGAGVALNLLVIVANGGFMPVTPEALVASGIVPGVENVAVNTVLADSKSVILSRSDISLRWLSDTIVLRPVQKVVSVGDLLLVAGMFFLIQEAMLRGGGD